MKQLQMFDVSDPALDAAKDLIRSSVKCGRTPKEVRLGWFGNSVPNGMSACIGGYLGEKYFGWDYILVKRDINGNTVDRVFCLDEVYDLIAAE